MIEVLGVIAAFLFIVLCALAWAMLTEDKEHTNDCGCNDQEIYKHSDSTRYKGSSSNWLD